MKTPGIKPIILFMCVALIGTLIAGGITKRSTNRELEKTASENMELICSIQAEEIDSMMEQVEQTVDTFSVFITDNLEAADRMISDVQYMNDYTEELIPIALNAAGNTKGAMSVFVRYNPGIVTSVPGFYLAREGQEASFEQHEVMDLTTVNEETLEMIGLGEDEGRENGPEEGRAAWFGPYFKHNAGISVISYIAPLYNDGIPIGCVGMDIACSVLEERIDDISVYETGHALLVDSGKATHYHPAHIPGEWSEDISEELLSIMDCVEECREDVIYYGWNGESLGMVCRRLRNGMYLVICAPENEIYAAQEKLSKNITLLMALVFFIVILGAIAAQRGARYAIARYIEKETKTDALTGACSRSFFYEKAKEKIEKTDEQCYIIRLNVCNLTNINDLYGRENGDRLLQQIGADLLKDADALGFLCARFNADHFFLCIQRSAFEQFSMERRVNIEWLDLDIYLTYGIYPVEEDDPLSVSSMCTRAEIALTSGRGDSTGFIHFYNSMYHERMLRKLEIEHEMETALETEQFHIYVQPKYNPEDCSIAGGEVLVRWFHPEKGMISPGEFIPLFEKNGFIRKLDYYIWRKSFAFIREARSRGADVPPISINVSRSHFYGTDFQRDLMDMLKENGLQPSDVELEITESIYGESPEIIIDKCAELRAAGFSIAMDDFGSGYSSLNMLKELPLDILKMDLRFLANNLEERERGYNILRSLIEMAQALDLKVVVEGVETQEQCDFVRTFSNCTIQGYYFAAPMPAQEFRDLLDFVRGANGLHGGKSNESS